MTQRQWLNTVLRRTRVTIFTVSLGHMVIGIGLLAGGSIYNSKWSDSAGPVFIFSSLCSLLAFFRPDLTWSSMLSGVVGCLAHLSRCVVAVVLHLDQHQISAWTTVIVVATHAMFARVLYDMWLTRIVPMSLSLDNPNGFET